MLGNYMPCMGSPFTNSHTWTDFLTTKTARLETFHQRHHSAGPMRMIVAFQHVQPTPYISQPTHLVPNYTTVYPIVPQNNQLLMVWWTHPCVQHCGWLLQFLSLGRIVLEMSTVWVRTLPWSEISEPTVNVRKNRKIAVLVCQYISLRYWRFVWGFRYSL